MNSIGFKHFRRFANFPSIDLGDVTILVGGNNSGKSTIVKAFLLCVDNLNLMTMNDRRRTESKSVLSFSMPIFRFDANAYHDPKVKTFARAIHNKPVEDLDFSTLEPIKGLPNYMTFTFTLGQFTFTFKVMGNRDENLTTGDVASIIITDNKAGIRFSAYYDTHNMSYEVLNPDGQRDISLLQKLAREYRVTDEKLKKAEEEGDLDSIATLSTKRDKLAAQLAAMTDRDSDEFEISPESIRPIVNEIVHNVWEKNKPVKASYDMPLGIFHDEVYEPVVLNVISNIINFATTKEAEPKIKEGEDPNEYGSRVQHYMLMKSYREAIKLDLDVIKKSQEDLSDLLYSYDIEYIPAHAAHQDTIYKNDESDYLAKVVHMFYLHRIVKGEPEYEFVRHWMSEFEIGKDFEVKSWDGEAYRVDIIEKDDTVVPLGDKGVGSIQLMILLLRLATIMRFRGSHSLPTIIIIEEPEQNLHPKIQSRLAELFNEMALNNKCQFIIETHSEYIVRKAPVLVAEANYADEEDLKEHNPFKVYYLPEDGSDRYDMQFTTSGRFVNKFDEGFFDEAGKLNLITLRKERSGK